VLGEKGSLYLIEFEKTSTKNHVCFDYIDISYNFDNDVICISYDVHILILQDTLSHDNSHYVSFYYHVVIV